MALPAIPALAGAIGGLFALFINQIPPAGEWLSQELFNLFPNRIPNIAELILLRNRELITWEQFADYAQKNGFELSVAQKLYNSQEKLLGEGDLIASWRRGIISEDELNKQLLKYQYSVEDIRNIKKVSEYFPSPSDLVRFAVREVYTPEIVSAYGLKTDLPEQFIQESGKAGLPSEQALNYWAAHWELPSITQGFEMLHRGVINEEDLEVLLRSLDVMPFWREKLTQISYTPLTRVDVRRMYSLGVLDRDGVKRAYLDIGYNNDNAELMTDFTIKYESNEDDGLTRSSITTAYKKDLITAEQYMSYMSRLGYTQEIASFYGELVDYEKYQDDIEAIADNVVQQYELGVMTIDEVQSVLTSLDLPTVYVASTVNKLKIKSAVKTKLPTKADFENWLKLNIITESEYSVYMKKQGYDETDVRNYLEEINKEVDTSKRKYQSVTVYFRWFSTGIISEQLFRSTLQEMNVSNGDIDNYVKEYRKSLQEVKEK